MAPNEFLSNPRMPVRRYLNSAPTSCRVASNAGFDLIVTDDRTSYATQERFPDAREVHALAESVECHMQALLKNQR